MRSLAPPSVLFALLLAVLGGCEVPVPVPADDDDDSVPADDDDDSAAPIPAEATLGLEGGQVGLPDGTGMEMAPDSWSDPLEEAEVVITETEPGAFPESDDWDPLGTAFSLSPPMASEGEPFRIYVPLGGITKDQSWEDARLMMWMPGNAEGPEEEEISLFVPPAGIEGGRVYFELFALVADRYQGLMPQELPRVPAIPGLTVAGTQIGASCPAALQALGITPPSGMSSRVFLDSTPLAFPVFNRMGSLTAAQATQLRTSVNRMIARTCLAADRAIQYLVDDLVLPPPLTPAGARQVAKITLRATGGNTSGRLWGTANGAGVNIYLDPTGTFTGLGSEPSEAFATTATGLVGYGGWNTAPTGSASLASVRDFLDAVIVHELFHWVDWNADLNPENANTYASFNEGAATAVQDGFVDIVRDADYAQSPLWSTSMFIAATPPEQMRYQAQAFWRFLDWTSPPPNTESYGFTSVALNRVRTLAAARPRVKGLPDTQIGVDATLLDEQIRSYFFSPSYGFDAAFVDFAAQTLFEHGYERPTPSSQPGVPALPGDRHRDRDGRLLEETGIGELWGAIQTGLIPAPNTLTAPGSTALNAPSDPDVPTSVSVTIPASQARAVVINLAPWVSPGDLTIKTWASAGSAGQKAFLRRPGVAAAPRAAVPSLPTSEVLAAEERVGPPGSGGDVVLILANPSPTGAATVQVRVEGSAPGVGFGVLSSTSGAAQGSLSIFEVQGVVPVASTPTTGDPSGVALGTGAWGSVYDPNNQSLFVIDELGYLRQFDSTGPGTERDTDLDPSTTSPGAPPGITRPLVGPEPRGIELVYDAAGEPFLMVSTAAGLVIVDGALLDVLATVPWTAFGLPSGQRLQGLGYADGPGLLFGAPRYPNSLQDTSHVYSVPVDNLLGWSAGALPGVSTLAMLGACLAGTPVVSPDEAHVAFPCLSARVVRQFSVPGGAFEGTLNPPGITQTDSPPVAVQWSTDSQWVYAVYLSGQIAGGSLNQPVVRRCMTVAPFDCGQEVGFGVAPSSGSAIGVTGSGPSELIWLGDSEGGVSRATPTDLAVSPGYLPPVFDVGDASIRAVTPN